MDSNGAINWAEKLRYKVSLTTYLDEGHRNHN